MLWQKYTPGLREVTPSPILSTIPAPSWPRTQGNSPSRGASPRCASVWHTPVASRRIRTSFALGGATSTVSITRGFLGSQATAALHWIT